MKRLTDVRFWDEKWWKLQHPRRLWMYKDFHLETVRLLRSAAGSANRGKDRGVSPRVLELGGGGSRMLPYLAKKFGYKVCGSDFSYFGCSLYRKNLALQGVTGEVVCEDFLQSSLDSNSFDLVYSVGLIEHFEETSLPVREHLRLVKPGGRLVLVVPNFQGVQGAIWKRLAPPVCDRHRIFGPEELTRILDELGLRSIRSGYLGSFFINVGQDDDWPVVRQWPRSIRFIVCQAARLARVLISFFFRIFPLRPHTRAWSPEFYVMGTKAGA